MKGDWFCPCLLFFIGAAWLGVSSYFATTNWLRVIQTERDFTNKGTCYFKNQSVDYCSYFNDKQVERQGCSLVQLFYGNISVPGQPIPPAQPLVAVAWEGEEQGCILKNCREVREMGFNSITGPGATTDCWADKRGDSPTFLLKNPAGRARRDRIIFTACAAAALLIIFAMLCVMCGLLCRSCSTAPLCTQPYNPRPAPTHPPPRERTHMERVPPPQWRTDSTATTNGATSNGPSFGADISTFLRQMEDAQAAAAAAEVSSTPFDLAAASFDTLAVPQPVVSISDHHHQASPFPFADFSNSQPQLQSIVASPVVSVNPVDILFDTPIEPSLTTQTSNIHQPSTAAAVIPSAPSPHFAVHTGSNSTPAAAALAPHALFPTPAEPSSGSGSGSSTSPAVATTAAAAGSATNDADPRAWGIAVAMSNAQRYAMNMWEKEVEERRPQFGTTSDRDLKRKETNRKSAKVSRLRRREYLNQLEQVVLHGEQNTQKLKAEVDAIDREQQRLAEQVAYLRQQLSQASAAVPQRAFVA